MYELDNSAAIHLASRTKDYTNCFRIEAELKEEICPVALQKAVETITPRFPTIIAGIKKGPFFFRVVPVAEIPQIEKDTECLASMSKRQIEKRAIRFLYKKRKIAVEIFHALTDGYGGLKLLEALVLAYLAEKHPEVKRKQGPWYGKILSREIADDFLTYASGKKGKTTNKKAYQLPWQTDNEQKIEVTTLQYDTKKLLEQAHKYGVSLTAYLTAILEKSIIEIQKYHESFPKFRKPVQVLVPINMRKIFGSKTLRNFTLYALPCVMPAEQEMLFEDLVRHVANQIKQQTTREHLAQMITTNVKLQNIWFYKILPLPIKTTILKFAEDFFGSQTLA